MNNYKKLEDLGYSDFFKSQTLALNSTGHSVARVMASYRDAYRVKNINGEYLAKITGKHLFEATKREDYPVVGDWVVITERDNNNVVINDIFSRKTLLRKKYNAKQERQVIAANVDTVFIVEAIGRDYNLNRLERYLVLANESGIKSVIILNKIDLISDEDLHLQIEQIKKRFHNIEVIPTSAVTEQGLDKLIGNITKRETHCFLGSSGVGKSTLINILLKKKSIKTKEISSITGRGKHTTTVRDMYFLKNGGIVIDNPGMREVGIADLSVGLAYTFDEISELSKNCKYTNCTHIQEKDCAVLDAVKSNELDEAKYSNYIKLKKETDYYSMTDLKKRQKNRKFGKFVKKALEQLEKYER
jgi:ribosome biogenesis GTPase / thiamine phosphate phosphatase